MIPYITTINCTTIFYYTVLFIKILNKYTISALASNVLDTEIQELLKKGAICMVGDVHEQYVSSYFAVPKSRRSPEMQTNPKNKKVHYVYTPHTIPNGGT